MKIVIHDMSNEQFNNIFPKIKKDTLIITENKKIHYCIGCFGCWIKTPGKCIINDGYANMGYLLSQADEVCIISKCYYGGYSPFIKNILDRSISYMLPFFMKKNHETHHRPRYKNHFQFSVYFYGKHFSNDEMCLAQKLVKANSINFHAAQHKVNFYESPEKLGNEVKCI